MEPFGSQTIQSNKINTSLKPIHRNKTRSKFFAYAPPLTKPKNKRMKAKSPKLEPLTYFLSLSNDILPEIKDFLFDLMAETARAENLTANYKEDRIYLILQLHQLFAGLERSHTKE